jgi:hypothetical protein
MLLDAVGVRSVTVIVAEPAECDAVSCWVCVGVSWDADTDSDVDGVGGGVNVFVRGCDAEALTDAPDCEDDLVTGTDTEPERVTLPFVSVSCAEAVPFADAVPLSETNETLKVPLWESLSVGGGVMVRLSVNGSDAVRFGVAVEVGSKDALWDPTDTLEDALSEALRVGGGVMVCVCVDDSEADNCALIVILRWTDGLWDPTERLSDRLRDAVGVAGGVTVGVSVSGTDADPLAVPKDRLTDRVSERVCVGGGVCDRERVAEDDGEAERVAVTVAVGGGGKVRVRVREWKMRECEWLLVRLCEWLLVRVEVRVGGGVLEALEVKEDVDSWVPDKQPRRSGSSGDSHAAHGGMAYFNAYGFGRASDVSNGWVAINTYGVRTRRRNSTHWKTADDAGAIAASPLTGISSASVRLAGSNVSVASASTTWYSDTFALRSESVDVSNRYVARNTGIASARRPASPKTRTEMRECDTFTAERQPNSSGRDTVRVSPKTDSDEFATVVWLTSLYRAMHTEWADRSMLEGRLQFVTIMPSRIVMLTPSANAEISTAMAAVVETSIALKVTFVEAAPPDNLTSKQAPPVWGAAHRRTLSSTGASVPMASALASCSAVTSVTAETVVLDSLPGVETVTLTPVMSIGLSVSGGVTRIPAMEALSKRAKPRPPNSSPMAEDLPSMLAERVTSTATLRISSPAAGMRGFVGIMNDAVMPVIDTTAPSPAETRTAVSAK